MIEFQIITTAFHADDLSNQLMLLGAAAVTFQDAGNQPIYEPKPGEAICWDRVTLLAIFEDADLAAPISAYLQQQQAQDCLSHFEIINVPEKDWVRLNQEQSVPLQFGKRLWLVPSWHTPPDPQAVNILFNAGVAFGTGSHPTTALCLEWLEASIRGNESMIDYGCGSGVLAVAALKLGASRAIAIDYDPQALVATRMNADLNHLSMSQLPVYLPDQFTASPVDILIANILAKPLIELAPRFAECVRPGGQVVLSGIMATQYLEVIDAYTPWFAMTDVVMRDGWVRLAGMRLPAK